MTGRGIDRVLPHPGSARLHEPDIRSAVAYVDRAELANGPIPKPVDFAYPWGDALAELDRRSPDARIINLETTVTSSDDYWKGRHIHYRMHRGIPRRLLRPDQLRGRVLRWLLPGLSSCRSHARVLGP